MINAKRLKSAILREGDMHRGISRKYSRCDILTCDGYSCCDILKYSRGDILKYSCGDIFKRR